MIVEIRELDGRKIYWHQGSIELTIVTATPATMRGIVDRLLDPDPMPGETHVIIVTVQKPETGGSEDAGQP